MPVEVAPSAPIPDAVELLLRDLPEWFGIEEALQDYVASADHLPTFVARRDADAVGVCLIAPHGDHAAEIHLLAVARRVHRQGIGRALLGAVEQHLAARGCELLQVKTLGPSRTSPEYEATRRFYQALGYRHLEEFPAGTIWPDNPCLIMAKSLTRGD